MEIANVILLIAALFFLFLFIKIKIKKICALCAAVSLTWILLFVFYLLGNTENIGITILLMGSSVTGLYYLIEKKLSEEKKLFNLPIFLTLLAIAYQFWSLFNLYLYLALFGVWAVFIILYYGRKNNHLKNFAKKIIECCKNW